jgi:uncharacterized iron-regulated membrane protein
VAKEVHDLLYKGDIDPKQTVTGCGGWTTGIFTGRWLRASRPGQSGAVHSGAFGPVAIRILWFAGGLCAPLLAITGVISYVNRRITNAVRKGQQGGHKSVVPVERRAGTSSA